MLFCRRTAIVCIALTGVANAQQWNVSFTGGTRLTNDFPTTEFTNPADRFGNPANYFRFRSGERSPILGASFEARLNSIFSFEASVLHRELQSEITFREFPVGQPERERITNRSAARTWVFPLLLKYHLPARGAWRPFLSAGPSFRTQEDVAGAQPSQAGFSAGAGATYTWKRLTLSPTLRYTRWRREDVFPRYATKPDQLEFLTSIGFLTSPSFHRIGGSKIHFGALFGFPLLRGFDSFPFFERPQERLRYAAGIQIEADLPKSFAIEVNGIYNPIRAKGDNPDRRIAYSVLTWQIPVLVKKYWDVGEWKPFVAGGPSFRLSGNLNGYEPSKFGGTIGAGVSRSLGPARISPSLRYTRWRNDSGGFFRTYPHSLELLVGISF